MSERAIVRLNQSSQTNEQQIDLNSPKACVDLQSHYHIARRIGITYEECVQLFKQLHGIVSYHRGGKITVIDELALNKIAQGSANL